MGSDESSSENINKIRLDVWHPDCWGLSVTEEIPVGLLCYGVFRGKDGKTTTRFTLYGDDQPIIEEAIRIIKGHPAVYNLIQMSTGYSHTDPRSSGNASQEVLIEYETESAISPAFTSRGFTYAAPCDTRNGTEHWTLFGYMNRKNINKEIKEIQKDQHAEISIRSISTVRESQLDPIPMTKLSHRQREVFQLARDRGYYRQPKAVTAEKLASELGITTSTFHEHLHKAEEKVLDRS